MMIISKFKNFRNLLILIILTAVIIFSLRVFQTKENLVQEEILVKIVDVEKIKLTNRKPEYLFYGNIKGINQVDIVTKLNGRIIYISPKVIEASNFEKGEIIFRIDDYIYKQELSEKKSILYELKNELEATELIHKEVLKQLELSKKNFIRMQKLSGDIVTKKSLEEVELNFSITRSKMLDIKAKIESIKSNIQVAKAQLNLANRNLNDAKYKAPFDGKIYNNLIEIGAEVNAGKTLGVLTNTNLLNVEFFVGESVYTKIGNILNKKVRILWKNSNYKNNYIGKVFYSDSTIDQDRSGLNMKAKLEDIDADDPMIPGVFVEVIIEGSEVNNSFLVDEKSIYEEKYVYILNNNQPIKRQIVIQGNIGNKVLISGDLKQEELLIKTRISEIKGKNKILFKTNNE